MAGTQTTVTLVVASFDTVTLVGGSGSEDNKTCIALEMGQGRVANHTFDAGHVTNTSTTLHLCGNKADSETFI